MGVLHGQRRGDEEEKEEEEEEQERRDGKIDDYIYIHVYSVLCRTIALFTCTVLPI